MKLEVGIKSSNTPEMLIFYTSLPFYPNKPGMSDRSDGTTEFTVNAPAVVEFLICWSGRTLIFNTADATDPHNEDDQHQDKRYT